MEAGEIVEAHLATGNLKEAWGTLKAWYNHAGDRPQKPSRHNLEVMTTEGEDLYRKRTPPGESIPIVLNKPFDIPDGPLTKMEIADVVSHMP
jgi:hypothetical protein